MQQASSHRTTPFTTFVVRTNPDFGMPQHNKRNLKMKLHKSHALECRSATHLRHTSPPHICKCRALISTTLDLGEHPAVVRCTVQPLTCNARAQYNESTSCLLTASVCVFRRPTTVTVTRPQQWLQRVSVYISNGGGSNGGGGNDGGDGDGDDAAVAAATARAGATHSWMSHHHSHNSISDCDDV